MRIAKTVLKAMKGSNKTDLIDIKDDIMIIILISKTCFERPQLQSCSLLHHVELEMATFGGSAAGFCINVAFSNQYISPLSEYISI